MLSLPGPIVSTAWLADHLDAVAIVDASYYLPAHKRDAAAEYAAAHIPGAVRFDIDKIADPTDPRPHMVPTAAAFASAVAALGIGMDRPVIAYDGFGLLSAARAWWMFRLFGFACAAVLDGGLPKWRAEGRAITSDVRPPAPARFQAALQPALIVDGDGVAAALAAGEPVIDVRAADRFAGSAPEPRAGVRSGHMPGAINLPYGQLLQGDFTLKPPAELRQILQAHYSGAAIASCGSGVTACILALAAAVADLPDVVVYDGSWSDWGSDPARPVVQA
jgi:thiosulfate/3-mercaptopyruvate sulfurtransferase